MEHWIKTKNGHRFDYNNPSSNLYDYDEIAVALSREQRFANHLELTWTVGQHALLVHKIATLQTEDRLIRKLALHHDDLEAYFRDLPTPLKTLCRDYQNIYKRHEAHYYLNVLHLPPQVCRTNELERHDYFAMLFEDVLFGSNQNIKWHEHTRETLKSIDDIAYNSELFNYIQLLMLLEPDQIVDKLKLTRKHYL